MSENNAEQFIPTVDATKATPAELAEALRLYRLENRLSFVKLAVDVRVSRLTLKNFIDDPGSVYDTTVYTIRKFLIALTAPKTTAANG